MSYSSKAVANKFIDVAHKHGELLTPMKLQKLVYYAHGWYLSLKCGSPLINEKIEAWPYGPVIPSIYHEFKSYGGDVITRYATEIDNEFQIVTPQIDNGYELDSFMEKIWEVYGKYSGIQLSNMTHEPGSPWATTWGTNGVAMNTDINDDVIKNYFDKLRV